MHQKTVLQKEKYTFAKRFTSFSSILLTMLCSASAFAQETRIGVMLRENLTSTLKMEKAVNFAASEANNSNAFLDGTKIVLEFENAYCNQNAKAVETALHLVKKKKISALIGGACSGVAIEKLEKVVLKENIVMISPSATSPFLSVIEDKDLFFRTAPSDDQQSTILTEEIFHRQIDNISVAYINTAYGFALAQSAANSLLKKGGKIIHMQEIPQYGVDYTAEAKEFAARGGQAMLIAGRFNEGAGAFLEKMIARRTFRYFIFPEGMITPELEKLGDKIEGSFGVVPKVNKKFVEEIKETANIKVNSTDIFTASTYDAAALIILAMQAAGSTKPEKFSKKIMSVANPPGVKIKFGEIEKALRILNEGGEIDLVGATNLKMVPPGESTGNYTTIEIKEGKITQLVKK